MLVTSQRWLRPSQAALVGLIALVSFDGCARAPRISMPGFGPSFAWGSKADEFESSDGEIVSEATVQANTAHVVGPPSVEESGPVAGSSVAGPTSLSKTTGTHLFQTQPGKATLKEDPFAKFGVDPILGVAHAAESESPEGSEAAQGVTETGKASSEKLQQLRDALTADVERTESEQETSVVLQPLRMRADALVERARELQKLGYLPEARRAAQQAMALTETGQFEFLPNETRPLDLLNQIDEEIASQKIAAADQPSLTLEASQGQSAGADVRTFIAQPQLVSEAIGSHARSRGPLPALTRPQEAVRDLPPVDLRPGEESCRVVANRPIVLTSSKHLVSGSASQLPGSADLVKFERGVNDVPAPSAASQETAVNESATNGPELVLPELPPFRGDQNSSSAAFGPALPREAAPAPPLVEELQPFPSVKKSTTNHGAAVMASETESRPMFSNEALVWATALVGIIFSVVGCGLMIRRMREFR